MRKKLFGYIKNSLLPCMAPAALTGFFSAIIITAFKLAAEWAVHLSMSIYSAVRADARWLPLLILGAAVIGLVASLILFKTHSGRGGGIPTSVAAIRGIISYKWTASLLLVPIASFLSFLAGLPLGTEGPCVQMGTGVGDGISKIFGKGKNKGWRRYIMTAGASAGFSIATVSPLSAIIFAMEELHKRFSPLILSVSAVAVVSAQVTLRALAVFGIGDVHFFHVPTIPALSLRFIFVPAIIGAVTGGCSLVFSRLYRVIDKAMRRILKKLPITVVFPIIFTLVAIVGFFFAETLGSGHSLVDSLFASGGVWYMLLLVFLIRALGMMVSNTSGITGGIFLPTLAFGAIIGALLANVMISLGWVGEEYYLLMVVLGITAFLGSTSQVPLTACVFAVEALGGINNLLPIIVATAIAFIIVEASGTEDFTDTVIEAKLHKLTKGKKATTVVAPLTVSRGSFVIGKNISDVLWPNSCVVVSFTRAVGTRDSTVICEGDVILMRYTTYDTKETAEELLDLVGTQAESTLRLMTPKA